MDLNLGSRLLENARSQSFESKLMVCNSSKLTMAAGDEFRIIRYNIWQTVANAGSDFSRSYDKLTKSVDLCRLSVCNNQA